MRCHTRTVEKFCSHKHATVASAGGRPSFQLQASGGPTLGPRLRQQAVASTRIRCAAAPLEGGSSTGSFFGGLGATCLGVLESPRWAKPGFGILKAGCFWTLAGPRGSRARLSHNFKKPACPTARHQGTRPRHQTRLCSAWRTGVTEFWEQSGRGRDRLLGCGGSPHNRYDLCPVWERRSQTKASNGSKHQAERKQTTTPKAFLHPPHK